MDSRPLPPELLTVKQTAEYLGISTATLYDWRYRGEGPRSYKVGSGVRYSMADVLDWLETCAETPRPQIR